MLINTINKQNFITTIDMDSRQNALRTHIGWSGYGKSRLSNVTYYYDITSIAVCYECDYNNDGVICEELEQDEFGFKKCRTKVKLQMPISKYTHKKTHPILIVNRQKKRFYELF